MKRLGVFTIILSLVLTGCIAVKPNKTVQKVQRDYIVYNLGKFPADLIMLDKENIRQQDLLGALFEGLVKYSGVNEKTGKDTVVPAIAKSWSISKDETTYTFNIRESAYWSDGNKITAYDFVELFHNILKPGQSNYDDYDLFCISGAKEYREGKTESSGLWVKAVDKNTLEIKLDYPYSFFLNVLAQPIYGLRKFDDNLNTWEHDYKNILFSGPFIIQSLNNNDDEIVLEKSKNYWNSSAVKSSKIVMTSIEGSEESFAKYLNSDIDVLVDPPESEIDELTRQGNIENVSSETCSYIAFNFKSENIKESQDLRKSVAYSVNKSDLYTASSTVKTSEAFAFRPSTTDTGKNEKSEGNVTGKVDKKFDDILKFVFLDNKDNKTICEHIADATEKAAGVRLELYPLDENDLLKAVNDGDYDMAKIDIEGDPSYPFSFLQKLMTNSKFNSFGYSNLDYDKLIKEVQQEEKDSVKTQYLQKAQSILAKDIPVIPLYYYDTVLCRKNNVTGIMITKKGNIMLDKAYYGNV